MTCVDVVSMSHCVSNTKHVRDYCQFKACDPSTKDATTIRAKAVLLHNWRQKQNKKMVGIH